MDIELIADRYEAEAAEQEYINEHDTWETADTTQTPKTESELPF